MSSWSDLVPQLVEASQQTLVMVALSLLFAALLGLPLGVWLHASAPGGLAPHRTVNSVVGWIVNTGRSVPFIILLVLVAPLTRLVTGTTIGPVAAVVPLTLGAAPFLARLVESALREVDPGTVEAAHAMGATRRQIITSVLLREAAPGLVSALTVTGVALVGYSAMAGAIGGGGLGDVAIRYGYQRFDTRVTIATVVLMVAGVQILQWVGDRLARRLDHR